MNKVSAMFRVKAGRPVVKICLRLIAIIGSKLTRTLVSDVYNFCSFVHTLQRRGGTRFAVIYLKAAATVLQQAVGGQRIRDMSPLGLRFKRSRSGLPKVIPAHHRVRIKAGDIKTIRLWMTLFSLYRVLEFRGQLKLSSITDPCTMPLSVVPHFADFVQKSFIPLLFGLVGKAAFAVFPRHGPITGLLKAKPYIIRKSSPVIDKLDPLEKGIPSQVSTSPLSLIFAAHNWRKSDLYPVLSDWCKLTGNQWLLNAIDRWSKAADQMDKKDAKGFYTSTGLLGRLGLKEEPAGKIRVFAMVDAFTQWLMKPLHDRIFNLLSRIPQDGTFNQTAPLEALLAREPAGLYSYDLSSATDRLPLVLQKVLLSRALGSWGAELWGRLLTDRSYRLFESKLFCRPTVDLRYSTGQPMGALSSWAMLALTHHAVVQWAAVRAGELSTYKPTWFTDYALLGDDIVIGNLKVAKEYKSLMGLLGVSIGDHKSLVSTKGLVAEFAKRFYVKRDGKFHNASPISAPMCSVSIQSVPAGLETVKSESMSPTQYLTMLGYGYKSKSKLDASLPSLNRRLRNYILSYLFSSVNSGESLLSWYSKISFTRSKAYSSQSYITFLQNYWNDSIALIQDTAEKYPRQDIMKLVQVKRDREYYGTAARVRDPHAPTFSLDLSIPAVSQSLDEIIELVYRETYLDAVITVRDVGAKIDNLISDPSTADELFVEVDSLYSMLKEAQDAISELPELSGLSERVVPNKFASFKRVLDGWYYYSKMLTTS
jgi:hypothetical protein